MLSDKKLIIIQWTGGNDGLNTFVPVENDIYFNARPKLHIQKKESLRLNELYGFHPQLTYLHQLFEEGKLSIINNVGYPNADRSHFRSMDIWQSAMLNDDRNLSGWLGRYLDLSKDNFPNNVGAIETSSLLSTGLKGIDSSGICIDNFLQMREQMKNPLFSDILKRMPNINHDASEQLLHIYQKVKEGINGVEYLFNEYNRHAVPLAFSDSELSKDFKFIADLIIARAETQIFYVSYGSFDTHVNQKVHHEKLLHKFDQSLQEFISALQKHDVFKDVCILIFSEFGRRVRENGSRGTDHGQASNVYVINDDLHRAGIYNQLNDLSNLVDGDIPFELDFRRIYASILDDWLSVDSNQILAGSFDKLHIFNGIMDKNGW